MSFDSLTLDGYLSSPGELPALPCLDNKRALDELSKMLSCAYCPVVLKWRRIKKIKQALTEDGVISDFSLKLTKELKPTAYMRDGVGMYLSLGLLISRSPLTLLSVYTHELAHLWLSEQPGYPTLKRVQREFREAYKDDKLAELMSPIEIYANTVARYITEHIPTKNERQKRLLQGINTDRSKKIELMLTRIKESRLN